MQINSFFKITISAVLFLFNFITNQYGLSNEVIKHNKSITEQKEF